MELTNFFSGDPARDQDPVPATKDQDPATENPVLEIGNPVLEIRNPVPVTGNPALDPVTGNLVPEKENRDPNPHENLGHQRKL